MKEVALEIDKSIFLRQLPKCIIISLLIDAFMLISKITDKIYFFWFSRNWYPYTGCFKTVGDNCELFPSLMNCLIVPIYWYLIFV